MGQKLVCLGLAGAAGTIARYGLAGLLHRTSNVSFPLGTLAVNLTGCFLAGLVWTLFESRWAVSGQTRVIVLLGFFGAFTTFSAFILETGELIRSAEWIKAGFNVALHNGLGFIALYAGVVLGRLA